MHREDVAVPRDMWSRARRMTLIHPVRIVMPATIVGEGGFVPFPDQIYLVVFALKAGEVGEPRFLGHECTCVDAYIYKCGKLF